MNLLETGIDSKIESRGFHSGQNDLTMRFVYNDTTIGLIDYSIFDGEISVQMIKVDPKWRRKGIGTEMLKKLQANYPDTEIEMGMLTDDGSALYAAIPKYSVPTEGYAEKRARIDQIGQKIASYRKMHDELMQQIDEPDFEKKRLEFLKQVEDWNDLYDELDELETELRFMKPMKTLITTR